MAQTPEIGRQVPRSAEQVPSALADGCDCGAQQGRTVIMRGPQARLHGRIPTGASS
jgi:hypothetical protein